MGLFETRAFTRVILGNTPEIAKFKWVVLNNHEIWGSPWISSQWLGCSGGLYLWPIWMGDLLAAGSGGHFDSGTPRLVEGITRNGWVLHPQIVVVYGTGFTPLSSQSTRCTSMTWSTIGIKWEYLISYHVISLVNTLHFYRHYTLQIEIEIPGFGVAHLDDVGQLDRWREGCRIPAAEGMQCLHPTAATGRTPWKWRVTAAQKRKLPGTWKGTETVHGSELVSICPYLSFNLSVQVLQQFGAFELATFCSSQERLLPGKGPAPDCVHYVAAHVFVPRWIQWITFLPCVFCCNDLTGRPHRMVGI